MKKATIIFIIVFVSALFPLEVLCQAKDTKITPISPIPKDTFALYLRPQRVSAYVIEINKPVSREERCWIGYTNSIHPAKENVNCSIGSIYYPATYRDMWGWSYVYEDIHNMADWTQILNPKL